MEKVNVVGVDVGFGNTKIYTSSGGRKFPTLISPAKGEALGESETIMLPSGKEYEIGTLVGAVETRSQDFFLSPEFRALVYYSLRNYHGKVVALGIGSPINWDLREKLREMLSGKHRFSYKGKNIEVEIIPFPFLQGWGGYIDFIYTLDGKYIEKEDVPAVYVDVGYNTIDILLTEPVFQGGTFKIRPKRIPGGTIELGTSRFYETIRFFLEKSGIRVPSVRFVEFVEEGITKNPWGDIFKEAREKALSTYLSEVDSELKKVVREYEPYIEKIVLFGGGAHLLKPILANYEKPISVGDEFSNARAFYKAAKAKVSKQNR